MTAGEKIDDTGKDNQRDSRIYYVDVVGSGVYECKAKGIFRKRKRSLL